MSDDGWTQVQPRIKKASETQKEPQEEGPSTPRPRTSSANDLQVTEKGRISRTAHRESKLEWSASKRREREARIERREAQRDKDRAAAKAAKEY